MPIPDYQTLMLPLLKAAADGKEHRVADVVEQLAQEFHLTQEDRLQLLPSGRQTTFANRVAWAKSFLVQAGLLEGTKWGCFRIAARGNQVLSKNPPRIDNDYLLQFDDFVSFRNRGKTSEIIPGSTAVEASEQDQTQTPDELIRTTVRQIDAALAKDILDRILSATPAFFESLVVKLLLAMGYGGSRTDAGQIVGRPGDHGIDGIIDQDSLGLDRVYIQAKRYGRDNQVSEPEIRAFSGSLGAAKANKGVFVTTSSFSQPARDFAELHPCKIVLIDGEKLTELMIRFNVGTRIEDTLYIKRIDEDFFINE